MTIQLKNRIVRVLLNNPKLTLRDVFDIEENEQLQKCSISDEDRLNSLGDSELEEYLLKLAC